MEKKQFNPEEYAKLKHRVEALQSRVRLDVGSEQDVAKRLLVKVEKKLKQYETTHEIPKQFAGNYSTTTNSSFKDFAGYNQVHKNCSYYNEKGRNQNFYGSNVKYQNDTRSEKEMIDNLGVLYAIFGSTYQTVLNYHVYQIRFKKQTTLDEDAFYQAYADIYEDEVRICEDVIIGFWPWSLGDDRCGDMQFAAMNADSIKKYDTFVGVYLGLLNELKDIWNLYFDEGTNLKLTGPVVNYIESSCQSPVDNKPKVQLNLHQRREVISKFENEIDTDKMKYLESVAVKYNVTVSNKYNNLIEFLEESGVIYAVETTGIYIWNDYKGKFGKLIGYKYRKNKSLGKNRFYCLYLN